MSYWPHELGFCLDVEHHGLPACGAIRICTMAGAEALAENGRMPDVNELKAEGLKCLARLAAMNASLSAAKIEVVVRPLRGARLANA